MPNITLKSIDKEISKFSTDANSLNQRAHEINMMILRHMAPTFINDDCLGNGDCTRVPKMVMAMPASWRRTEEIRWWTQNTPVRIKYSGGAVTDFGFDKRYLNLAKKFEGDELQAERAKWWNYEEAAMTPFFALAEQNSEESDPLTFEELVALVQKLGKRIEKKVEDGDVAEDDIASANALAERLKVLRFKRVNAANDAEGAESAAA